MVFGEEKPDAMAILLLVLVACLHLLLAVYLMHSRSLPPKIETPKIMEVVLMTMPAEKPATEPPPPAATPFIPPPKILPVKKSVVKKPRPVIKKPAPSPKPEPIAKPKSQSGKVEFSPPTVAAPQPAVMPAPLVSTPAISRHSSAKHDPNKVVSGVVPLVRVPPKYPSRAISRHLEGWVRIEFTITRSGQVANAIVVAAEPADIFDNEALKAIAKWKFKEKLVDNVPVEQRAVQTLQFRLAD